MTSARGHGGESKCGSLAESGENVFSAFRIPCTATMLQSMPMLRDSEPGTFVGHFRRWLHS